MKDEGEREREGVREGELREGELREGESEGRGGGSEGEREKRG